MNSQTYWKRRAEEYAQEWQNRCQSELEVELAKYFKQSLSEIEKDIAALYGKFARDNKLSYSDAKKLIRGSEFKEWRMTLQEYIALSHSDSKILRELNTLSMRSRISRLEKLYSETLMHLQNMGEKYDRVVKDFLTTAYKERYYHGVNDLSKVAKLDIPVAKVEPAKLEQVLAQKWHGGNYSSRIWKNTEKLSQTLKTTLTKGLHRGLSVQKLSKSIAKELDVSYKNAERLVRTELSFVSNYAAKESLEAAGLEEYEYIATAGPRTCGTCSELNGTIHLLIEYSPGTNAPPMHPRCRCTISAVVEGKTKSGKIQKGALNDKNDPKYVRRDKHAELYYETRRNSKKEPFVKRVAENSGMRVAAVSKIFDHVFIEKHELWDGYQTFPPDYYMAESFRRLSEGKEIEEHDLIMLKHEWLELGLMKRYGYDYDTAHRITERKYNYKKALIEWHRLRGIRWSG